MKLITSIYLTLFSAFASIAYAAEKTGPGQMSQDGMMNGAMMDGGMMMSGPMMLVCMLFGLLILVVLVLAIFSLIKYLRGK